VQFLLYLLCVLTPFHQRQDIEFGLFLAALGSMVICIFAALANLVSSSGKAAPVENVDVSLSSVASGSSESDSSSESDGLESMRNPTCIQYLCISSHFTVVGDPVFFMAFFVSFIFVFCLLLLLSHFLIMACFL
jgi:hypothetical protein